MAKGSIAKQEITNKILEVFEGAFIDEKVIRIPMCEDGVDLEIKVALTCAKDVIGGGGSFAAAPKSAIGSATSGVQAISNPVLTAPTAEEQAKVENLLSKLGLA